MTLARAWTRRSAVAAAGLGCALGVLACGGGAPARSNSATSGTGASSTGEGSSPGAAVSFPAGDWPQFNDGPQHTGVAVTRSGITPANVAQLALRRVIIGGVADSSAIELHAVRIHGRARDLIAVTTTYGTTIAIDAGTGAKLWTFSPPGVNSRLGNPQVTTASPAADPGRRYLFTASPNGVIHKLSVASGRQVWARSITFDPAHEKIASALTISGRFVVAVTSGYFGDAPPYDGHVVMLDRASGRLADVWNTECSDRHVLIHASSCGVTNTQGDSAIWGRAGAVIEPDTHRILVATGNGPFDGRTSWGDSVLELSPDAALLLHNWTPTNQAQLQAGDTDVGSTSPALLPVYRGRRLVVQGGKDGRLHLLDLARLDGTGGGPGPRQGGELQEVAAPGGAPVFTAPAVWRHGKRTFVFVGDDSGTGAYELVGANHPRLRVAWQNATSATSPVLAGGLLYAYDQRDGAVIIRRPLSGITVRSLPVAAGHWNSPIVVGGRIIEPTGSYHDPQANSAIEIYHLPGR